VDYARHFQREVAAFEAAGRTAAGFEAAPAVPSCPGWVVTDLTLHPGLVHRFVARIIGERMQQPPEAGDLAWLGLAQEWKGWLPPARASQRSSVPADLLDWFHDGAADLRERFRTTAAVHRWDAENAVGVARPLDTALATDAIGQTFEVMAPMRRTVGKAPPGHGERFLFQRTDGPDRWAVQFDGDAVMLGAPGSHRDIQISGTASDLALFLWRRAVR
jgi:uncharacterized protein (TIGR03083 family)